MMLSGVYLSARLRSCDQQVERYVGVLLGPAFAENQLLRLM